MCASRKEHRHGFYPCLKVKFCGKTHQILNTRNTKASEKPVVVFISNDNDTVIGVMVIKNDDENLQNNLEIIEKNWVAARNELLQRAREDDSIEADEDELHIAFIAHELEMFDEPYETIDISGVYSVSNGDVDRI